MNNTKVVCVVGGTGYLGSSLVKALLSRGYIVNATARDHSKAQFLKALPFANDNLHLFEADLLKEGSFDTAINGCDGVFLVASPVVFQSQDPRLSFTSQDPEKQEIEVAVNGTMNVLRSCEKAKTVKRVVFTSSVRACLHREDETRPGEIIVDESRWSDVDWLRQHKQSGWGYRVSKTLAERRALKFGEERGIQVVSVLPAMVGGPWFLESVPVSVRVIMSTFTGNSLEFSRLQPAPGFVHVDDVIDTHVFVMESPAAHGRYICCAQSPSLFEFIEFVRTRYPNYHKRICLEYEEKARSDGETIFRISSEKLLSLGFSYKHDLGEMLDETLRISVNSGYFIPLSKDKEE